MASGSPSQRKDSPSFFLRKRLDPSKDSPLRTFHKRAEAATEKKSESPKLEKRPDAKLSDVAQLEVSPTTALANFRARKKTISEYLSPLTGLFTNRRLSALERLSYRAPIAPQADEYERRRVQALIFGVPMRRFSVSHTQNIARSGTLRVRIISCTSNKLKGATHASMPAARRSAGNGSPIDPRKLSGDARKISGESTGSASSTGGVAIGSLLTRHVHHGKRKVSYYVEMELGGAKGRTVRKERLKANRRGEVRWDDSNAWIRLFVPGMEEGGDPILMAVSEVAKLKRRPLQVLKFKVICVVSGDDTPQASETHTVLFETAVELDRLISKGAPRWLELPLVNKDHPEEEDLGVLTLETRFDRLNPRRLSQEDLQFVEAAENLAAEAASLLILTAQRPNIGDDEANARLRQSGLVLTDAKEEDEALQAGDSTLSPVLMVPSAAAYLTTVAAGLVPTNLSRATSSSGGRALSERLGVVPESTENLRASWPLMSREQPRTREEAMHESANHRHRRFSCPLLGFNERQNGYSIDQMFPGANMEQLESLREGWRMWRMAHRSQLKPSHRAQDVAYLGERFINRANSSASPSHSLTLSPRGSFAVSPPSSPKSGRSLSVLDLQSKPDRTRTLFELGGDSYDVSNYLDDHPHQRAFLEAITARVGKIAMLEQISSVDSEAAKKQKKLEALEKLKQHQQKKAMEAKYWCRRKIAVLTGGTSGVGECIGRELCARGVKRLILLVRNLSSGRAKALEWTEKYKNVEVDVVMCDLSSMKDTNGAADQIRGLLSPGERLDLLVLCAACVSNETTAGPRKEFEETFAVNYMANFLLVHALFDLLERPEDDSGAETERDEARIVVAGCAAVPPFGNRVDLDDLQAEKRGIGALGVSQYIHTKTMLSCFAAELSRRLEDRPCRVTANVFYPGAVKSKLADNVLTAFNPVIAKLADAAYGLTEGILVRSPEQGASLAVNLCSSNELYGVNGQVFHSGVTGAVTDFDPHPPFGIATNTELCRKLWATSGKMLNQALGKESRVAEWWGYFKPARKNHHISHHDSVPQQPQKDSGASA